jgi:hypothetical protein
MIFVFVFLMNDVKSAIYATFGFIAIWLGYTLYEFKKQSQKINNLIKERKLQ